MCFKVYEIYPAKCLSAPGLARQAALKKTKVKLDLWTNMGTFLIVEKDIRERILHSICQYTKANNKYFKDCDQMMNRHIFNTEM